MHSTSACGYCLCAYLYVCALYIQGRIQNFSWEWAPTQFTNKFSEKPDEIKEMFVPRVRGRQERTPFWIRHCIISRNWVEPIFLD